jgi:hypothetical protein
MDPKLESPEDTVQTVRSALSSLTNEPLVSLKRMNQLLASDLDESLGDEDDAEEVLNTFAEAMLDSGDFTRAQQKLIEESLEEQKRALAESKDRRANVSNTIVGHLLSRLPFLLTHMSLGH